MDEIVRIELDNEMDLILAHKRVMKLLELCGLGLSLQTRFATAVSEIARCSITDGLDSHLVLSIETESKLKRRIVAMLCDKIELRRAKPTQFQYAERLAGYIEEKNEDGFYCYTLSAPVKFGALISAAKIKSFREYFDKELPLSPYDEIRRKNLQLIGLAEDLAESEDQYRNLSDNLPQLVFSMDAKGDILLTNRKFRQFFGQDTRDFSAVRKQVFRDDVAAVFPSLDESLMSRKAFRVELRLLSGNGAHWHQFSLVPSKDEHGNFVKWTGIFVDINAQKLVEQTLRDNDELKAVQQELLANKQLLEQNIRDLENKNDDLQQFARIVGHDLQEPLRKLQFFASFYEARDVQPKHDYSGKIVESAGRLRDLVSGLLSFSTFSSERQNFGPIDFNALIRNVVTDYELEINKRNAHIEIAEFPEITGVRSQLYQVFSNLMANALKFSGDAPELQIGYSRVDGYGRDKRDAGKSYHRIDFRDNGIGIDPSYKEFVFNIFKKIPNENNVQGTGLGLAICKKIIENHKGFIDLESSLGNGSTFEVFIPVDLQ